MNDIIPTQKHVEALEYGSIEWANLTYETGNRSFKELAKWLFDFMYDNNLTLQEAVDIKRSQGFKASYKSAHRWISPLPEYKALKQAQADNPSPEAQWKRDERQRKNPDNSHSEKSQAETLDTDTAISSEDALDIITQTLEAKVKELEKENEGLAKFNWKLQEAEQQRIDFTAASTVRENCDNLQLVESHTQNFTETDIRLVDKEALDAALATIAERDKRIEELEEQAKSQEQYIRGLEGLRCDFPPIITQLEQKLKNRVDDRPRSKYYSTKEAILEFIPDSESKLESLMKNYYSERLCKRLNKESGLEWHCTNDNGKTEYYYLQEAPVYHVVWDDADATVGRSEEVAV